jgi:hypothetical protein
MNRNNENRKCGLRDEYRGDRVGQSNEIRLFPPRLVVPLKRFDAPAENARHVLVARIVDECIEWTRSFANHSH